MNTRCDCGDPECPSCGIAQGTYTGSNMGECIICSEYRRLLDGLCADCDPGEVPVVSRDTFKFICELPVLHEGDEVIGMVKFMDDLLVCTKHGRLFRVEHTTNNVTECVLYEGTVPPGGSWDERGIVPPESW